MCSTPKIGLALGGGVVRGFAHLGVLEVLEAEGLQIDFVGGTSVGSIMGYCYAAGMQIGHMKEMAEELGWWKLARPIVPRQAFISFDLLEEYLIRTLGDLHLEDLARPLVIMATDVQTGESVALNSGSVAAAVCASCSVPGFVQPKLINGRYLVDGGISCNVPIDPVRGLGADYVIGVDIFEQAEHKRLGPLGMGITALEIMVRRSGNGLAHAECIIKPNLQHATYINFNKRHELMNHGRTAAQASLPEIRTELAALGEKQRSGGAEGQRRNDSLTTTH
jgi:NTE family protein